MHNNNMTRARLHESTQNVNMVFKFCKENNLLKNNNWCTVCNKEMKLKQSKVSNDGYVWKCSGKRCNKCVVSIRKGSFFERSKLPIKTILFLIYEWSRDNPIKEVCHEYGLSEHTVGDWFRFLRDICFESLASLNLSKKIGGESKIVEIDETVAVRRKYNRGRVVSTVWLVGGILRGKEFGAFLEIVPNRSAVTLEELILRKMERGSTIMTDLWKGYCGLESKGFEHFCVNHSLNFVDPNNVNVHTQKIEGFWGVLKRWLKRKGCNRKKYLDEYFVEFLYRKSTNDVFEFLVNDIAKVYNCYNTREN